MPKKDLDEVARLINEYLTSEYSQRAFCENESLSCTTFGRWLKKAEKGEIEDVNPEDVKKKKKNSGKNSEREQSLKDWINDQPDRPMSVYVRSTNHIPLNTLTDRIAKEEEHNEFGLRDALSDKKERVSAAPLTRQKFTPGQKVELKLKFVEQHLSIEQYARSIGQVRATLANVLHDPKVEVPGWPQEQIEQAINEREHWYRAARHATHEGRRQEGPSNPVAPSLVEPDNTFAPPTQARFPVNYDATTQRYSEGEAPYDPYSQPTQPSSSFPTPGWGSGVSVTQRDTPAGWSNTANTFAPPTQAPYLPPAILGPTPQNSRIQYDQNAAGPYTEFNPSRGYGNVDGGYPEGALPQHTVDQPSCPQPSWFNPAIHAPPGTGESASSYDPPPRQHSQSPGGPSHPAQHRK